MVILTGDFLRTRKGNVVAGIRLEILRKTTEIGCPRFEYKHRTFTFISGKLEIILHDLFP
jgi:hypothetical protein